MADADATIEYARGHLEEALATDGRVSEQGLHVDAVGRTLVVRGTVSTPSRLAAIELVAAEAVPDRMVRNEAVVVPLDEPDGEEQLA
jgi:hypothetical protein